MKYIKKNKLTVFIIVIFVVLVFIGAYIYNLFFSSGRKEAYGNRLDGIEEVRISDDTYKQIVKSLKENKTVTDASTDCKGKIVNIIITVTDEETKENAKKISETVLKHFDKEQLEFYDIQVFVKKNNAELNDFPIIGYKQNGKSGFTWTKDRAVVKDENK